MEKQCVENLINVLGKFKDLKRSGWIKKSVSNPESDAEHSFSLAFLVLILCPENLDKLRCLELALIHDLAEIYVGDYTPFDDISPVDKHNKELEAINCLAENLSYPKLIDLFNEYEELKTKESLFVKGLDKIDNVFTAVYYDEYKRSECKLTPEFGNYALKYLQELNSSDLDDIKTIVQCIVK